MMGRQIQWRHSLLSGLKITKIKCNRREGSPLPSILKLRNKKRKAEGCLPYKIPVNSFVKKIGSIINVGVRR